MQAAKAEKNKDLPEEHHETIDQGELYNGMAIQLAWDEIETHSPNWWKIQDEQEAAYAAEEQQQIDDSKKLAIEMMGMTAEQQSIAQMPEIHHYNKDVDFDIYNGISLVQTEDHVGDSDDIVPEFSEEVKVEEKPQEPVEEKKTDFAGQQFKEVYDEWASPPPCRRWVLIFK